MTVSVRDTAFKNLRQAVEAVWKMYGSNKTLDSYITDLKEDIETLYLLSSVVDDEYKKNVVAE